MNSDIELPVHHGHLELSGKARELFQYVKGIGDLTYIKGLTNRDSSIFGVISEDNRIYIFLQVEREENIFLLISLMKNIFYLNLIA